LDEAKIGWKDNIQSDNTELNLEVTELDLKEYIKEEQFSLRLNTETDELLASDHDIDVYSVLFVDAKVL
jgi:hypothetical protein